MGHIERFYKETQQGADVAVQQQDNQLFVTTYCHSMWLLVGWRRVYQLHGR